MITRAIVESVIQRYSPTYRGGEFNFRCPICGDSKKNKKKKRFYMSDNGLGICWNCGWSGNLFQFVMETENLTYAQAKEYILGNTIADLSDVNIQLNQSVIKEKKSSYRPNVLTLDGILPISTTNKYGMWIHNWLNARRITSQYWAYDPKYLMSIRDDTFGWLAVPVYYDGTIVEIQLRNIISKDFRTLTHPENDFVIYNYDNLNFKQPILVYEGPFDAVFTHNSTCLFGASKSTDALLEYFIKEKLDVIFVMDNDDAGRKALEKIYNKHGNKFKAFVWTSDLKSYKDINECIVNNINIDYKYIVNNSNVLSDAIAFNSLNII